MGGENGSASTPLERSTWDDFTDISTNPNEADPDEIELINTRVDQHEKEIVELKEEIKRLREEKNQEKTASIGSVYIGRRIERVFERCQQYQLPAGSDAFYLCLTITLVHWMQFFIVMNSYVRFIDVLWILCSASFNLVLAKTKEFSTLVKCMGIGYSGLICSLFLGLL
jgi:hypothetical protein